MPTTHPYGLGGVASPPDDRDHPLSIHLDFAAIATPRRHLPTIRLGVLDQGQTPECIGFSGSLQRIVSERLAEREPVRFDSHALYAECKAIDGDPGDGTYIRAACGVLKDMGGLVSLSRAKGVHKGDRLKISAYSRLVNLQEMRLAIVALGAAWLGSDWANSWFDPEPVEYHYRTTYVLSKADKIAGGHAYSALGYDDDFPVRPGETGAFLIQNNWSDQWGDKGRAWLPYSAINFTDGSFEAWRTFDKVGDL